jgi:hypothetical protein
MQLMDFLRSFLFPLLFLLSVTSAVPASEAEVSCGADDAGVAQIAGVGTRGGGTMAFVNGPEEGSNDRGKDSAREQCWQDCKEIRVRGVL